MKNDRPRSSCGIVSVCVVVATTAVEVASAAEPLAPMPSGIQRYCFECHDSDAAEAELDLEALGQALLEPATATATLEKILAVLDRDEMPPVDASSLPTVGERQEMIRWAKTRLKQLAARYDNDPGRVVMPRLTPAEYRNAIRDLSEGVVTNAGRFLPNEGGAGEGFSNVGQAQGINTAQVEKYLQAARSALRHLRVSPLAGLVWRKVPRDAVDKPKEARFELVNDIIAWHGEQQVLWGNRHLRQLERAYGQSHGLYLAAAWRYRWRAELGRPEATFRDIVRNSEPELSPLILAKWWDLLHQDDPSDNAAGVIAQWQALPAPSDVRVAEIRDRCRAIEDWEAEVKDDGQPDNTYAPAYERSFREDGSRDRVKAAAKQGRWPFEIDVGDARQLFLILTDYGDGNRDDYGSWHEGEFEFADGSTKNWKQLVTVRRLDGEPVPWGFHPKREGRGPESVGVHAPAILAFTVPEGAATFRVEFVITDSNARQSSVQALVLRQVPPAARRHVFPNRYVFGGSDSRRVGRRVASFDNFEREIRKRNIPSANRTKVGLNAERNVLFDWTETDVRYIGGPWSHQPQEEPRPLIPYYFTAREARRVATDDAGRRLADLRAQLAAIANVPHQDLLQFAKARGWPAAEEGVVPPADFVEALGAEDRKRFEALRSDVEAAERHLAVTAKRLLKTFATRAWRRPIQVAELKRLRQLYQDARAAGFSYDGAMKAPLLAILASPHFLYRHPFDQRNNEPSHRVADSARVGRRGADKSVSFRRLSGYELASRLSFFLWASIPDETLRRLAAEGVLHHEDVMRQQVRRMLRDRRAQALARQFGGQMWRFSGFEDFTGPDAKRFDRFTPELRQAMLAEVEGFLADLFQNDRPLTNLIDSDYVFVNSHLAEHYGITKSFHAEAKKRSERGQAASYGGGEAGKIVSDDAMIRVSAPANRGGLTGMALFLTRSSLPLRTSPVQRGVWVMEDILGRELPDPPAGVPAISDDETNDTGLTVRQQLEIHRADKSCASCHDKIDPMGIALENFDPIGRWREMLRNGTEVSASAQTHDGTPLDGPDSLRRYLNTHRDEFFRHFNRKLLGYALGRSVGPGDRSLLNKMATVLQQHEYRFLPLVETIVTSKQFRMRRAAAKPRS